MIDRVPRHNLVRARLRRGWTQERAANEISRRFPHLGMDVRQIARWESGETTPRPVNILALSTTYGEPPESLDLPPVPGAGHPPEVPLAPAPGAQTAAPSSPGRCGDDLTVPAGSSGGELVTLVVNRRDLLDALGGTVACSRVDDTGPPDERTSPVPRERLSAAERSLLGHTIARSIESAWALFHVAGTDHVLAVGRMQLATLRRYRSDLDPTLLPTLHSAAYRLLGATHHRRGCYEQALRAHDSAYLTAVEGDDAWSMAECMSWRAYGMQALGRHAESLDAIEAALRLVAERGDPESTRLRARLLTSAAMNLAALDDAGRATAMLHASEALLEDIPPLHEEFDRVAWLADAGVCALRLGHAELAVERLHQAVRETPRRWIARHILATIALARAWASSRNRDATLAVANQLIPHLEAIRTRELTDQFVCFLRTGLLASFPNDRHCLTLVGEAESIFSTDA